MYILGKFVLMWMLCASSLDILLTHPAIAEHFSPFELSVVGEENAIGDQTKEIAQFFKAKENLYKQDWAGAKMEMELYLRDYPSGRLIDEALYWIAQCLNRLSKAEMNSERMIALREEAILRLNDLIDRFKTSFWVKDAIVLRTEICRDLDYFGFSPYKIYLNPIEEKERETDRHIHVLRSLQELDREAARPILYNLAKMDKSPQVRLVAIFLLGQNERDSAIPFLQSLASMDPDEGVRKEAEAVVARIRMNKIPVRLNSYWYTARLTDESLGAQIREKEITLFDIPHSLPGENNAEAAVRVFLSDKIAQLKSYSADSLLNNCSMDYYGRYSGFSHSFGNNYFIFNCVNSDLKKERVRITGMIQVDDDLAKSKMSRPFSVDSKHDVLAVLRRGENLSLTLLQFEEAQDTRLARADIYRAARNPISRGTFTKLLGCVVNSTTIILKSRMGLTETNMLDLGPAKAEIPGSGGTWILEGNLLCDTRARKFIGRQFTLTDPTGQIVARGANIEVPASNPKAFKLK